MRNIWAVTRQTFAQCLRMKIVVAFILLLAAALGTLPFLMKGDGTLAGAIRTFMSYGVMITGGLLSIITVLVAVGVVAGDMRDKHILMLGSKPLGRWEYMLGRWGGVVMLNLVLLPLAGVSIYLVVQHMRATEAKSPTDRMAVETEIFTAREQVEPEMPDLGAWTKKRIEKLKKENRYQGIIEGFQNEKNLTPEKAREALINNLLREAWDRYETTGPYRTLTWKFQGIPLRADQRKAAGKVLLLSRGRGLFRISAPSSLVGKLIYNGPVQVNGVRGRVRALGRAEFDVEFLPDDMKRQEIRDLSKGTSVEVVAEPTFQFRYKVNAIGLNSEKKTLYRILEFRRANGEIVYSMRGEGAVGTPVTVTVPAVGALRGGNMFVVYRNVPAPTGPGVLPPPVVSVQIAHEDVSILYRVGGFEWNYIRSFLLIFVQLVFLAALGVFFGSFLSFPVATLACMVLLGSGWLVNWAAEAVAWTKPGSVGIDPFKFLAGLVIDAVRLLMPDMTQTSPAERLVDGIFISWSTVADTAFMTIVVRVTFYLLIGCLIFRRRELARVQI